MLSAIAARKAARQGPIEGPVVSEISSGSSTPRFITTPSSKPSWKRKPSSQASYSTNSSKRKKVNHERPRYFVEEDPFVQRDNVIIIDQDDLNDGSKDASEASAPFETSTTSEGKRDRSPSHLLHDSSDEEVDINDPHVLDFPVPARLSHTVVVENIPLSTFKSRWDENVFTISPAEIRPLGLFTRNESPTIALVMKPSETLCLLGTYTFAVTFGSVSLAGVDLNPSPKIHHVFAPRCSPVPVLQCLQPNERTTDQTFTLLPSKMHPFLKSGYAVIILQDLRTGVERLGQVCRIFNGVFEPSQLRRSKVVPDLGLTGVHVVRIINNSPISGGY